MTLTGWCLGTTALTGLAALGSRALGNAPAEARRQLWTLLPVLALSLPLLGMMLPDLAVGSLPAVIDVNRSVEGAAVARVGRLFFWLSALALSLARCMAGRRFRRDVVHAGVATPRELRQRVADAAFRAGIRRPITLISSSALASPVTWGVVRPTIALPLTASVWPTATLDAILAHECEHIRNGDVTWRLFSGVLLALQWFNPLVWHANRKLIEAQEAAADLVAVRRVGSRNYASILLEFAAGPSPATALPFAAAHRAEVEWRIRAILASKASTRWTVTSRRLLLVTLIAVAGGVASVSGPGAPQPVGELQRGFTPPIRLHPPPLPPLPPGRGPLLPTGRD